MQPTLFETTPVLERLHPPAGKSDSLNDQFKAFHEANPHVYRAIHSIALDLKRRGVKRAGMKAIFERLRWLYLLQTSGDEYKLNNNYTSFYARLLMQREPEMAGFFEIRGNK